VALLVWRKEREEKEVRGKQQGSEARKNNSLGCFSILLKPLFFRDGGFLESRLHFDSCLKV